MHLLVYSSGLPRLFLIFYKIYRSRWEFQCAAHIYLAGPFSFFHSTFITSTPLLRSCQLTQSIRSFACPLCHSLTNAQVTRDPKLINRQHELASVNPFACPPFFLFGSPFCCRNTPSHPYLLACRFLVLLLSWKDDVPQSHYFEASQDLTLVDDNHGFSRVTPPL